MAFAGTEGYNQKIIRMFEEFRNMWRNTSCLYIGVGGVVVLWSLLCGGCSMTRGFVVKESTVFIEAMQQSFLKEGDVEAAKTAFPTVIKLAEGFEGYDPHSTYYSGKLCFLYGVYAFGFWDNSPYDDLDDDENNQQQMLHYYKKAYYHGKKYLDGAIRNFTKKLQHKEERSKVLRKVKKKTHRNLILV